MSAVTALVRSAFLVNAVYADSAREFGLTPQQGQLLCVLMSGPYGMGELGETLGLAKSSLTGLVDRTAKRGLVRREAGAGDRRSVQVALTEEGAETAEEFYGETCRRVEALLTGTATEDLHRLAQLLGRVVNDNKVPVVFAESDASADS